MSTPRLSVVVPTHERKDSVVRLLRALSDGTCAPDQFEVIVVVDGSQDGTASAISALALPFALRVIEQSPARGAGHARNLGAHAARGDVLLFIDDDIEPLPGCVAAHLRAHDTAAASPAGDRLVLIGAPIPVRPMHPDFHQIAIWGWWEQQFERLAKPGHRMRYDDVYSGVLSLPASLFAAVGEFATNLPLSCRDDSELGLRLIEHGARIEFSRAAGGLHHESRDRRRMVERKIAEGEADVALARMHAELWPSLRVSWPDPTMAGPAALRGMAMHAPTLGDVAAGSLALVLKLLEALRMRGTWSKANAAQMYYWYWRGVRRALGSREALAELSARCRAAPQRETRMLDIDLRDGLDAAAERVDRERPRTLRVRLGSLHVGEISDDAGAESLRGAHLRPLLVATLGARLRSAIALDELAAITVSATPGALASGGSRVLARHGRHPLGWIEASSASGALTSECIDGIVLDELAVPLHGAALRRRVPAPEWNPATDPASPPISVVVCTRDRTESLSRCLSALRELRYPALEVLVVDNAPRTDETARLVADITPSFRAGTLRYVREPRPGLDWARNRGITEAAHEIIAFTDDDVRVDSEWLAGIASAFADPTVMAATGLVAPAELDSVARVLYEDAYGGMGKGFAPIRWERASLREDQLLGAHHIGVGANMAYRRPVFHSVGDFDTALDVGTPSHGGGDLEMLHRVLVSGAAIRYEPSALVWHSHRRDVPALARQLRDDGRAFSVYLITCWRRRTVSRRVIAQFVAIVWLPSLAGQLVRSLMGRASLPPRLVVQPLVGVLQAPWANWRTRRHDREMRHIDVRRHQRSESAPVGADSSAS